VTRLDEDGLARLVAAMLALPGEAVEQFYAAWEKYGRWLGARHAVVRGPRHAS
jgi:hypothetical protein